MPDMHEAGRLNKQRSTAIEREWSHASSTTRITDSRGARQPDLRVGPWDVEIKSRIGFVSNVSETTRSV